MPSPLDLNAPVVAVQPPALIPVTAPAPPPQLTTTVPVVLVAGPQGPPGAPGPTVDPLTRVFNGDGPPPALIVGSKPGDYYVDNSTGTFYKQT